MGDKRARLQKKFDAVEKAGGIKLPNIKTLSFKERNQCIYSIWGFLFIIVYYGYHGVWKKGLSLLAIGLIITLLLDFIIMNFIPTFYDAWGDIAFIITSVLFATRAPVNLYSKYILNENGWNPFK
jgi:hypothetical protein